MTSLYTYRITLNSLDTVVAEKRDTQNIVLGEPEGLFSYKVHHEIIHTLAHKAFTDEINEKEIETLGEALFNTLFDQGLRNDFLTFYNEVVHHKRTLLRLELDINETKMPEMVALPWEFLRVPDNPITANLWLATAPNLIFSRRRAQWIAPQPIQLAAGQKLRLAVVVSTPQDEELGTISYTKLFTELETLKTELGDQVEVNLIDPATRPATRYTIDDVLETEPHIFHFVGHGRFQNNVGEVALVRDNGRTRWVSAERFANLLARHRPGIVLLQACEGAQTAATDAFAGVGSQIVKHNIPVVVAMQYKISNATARKFAREFYRRLAQGDPVDKAAQEGRYEISDWHEKRDFATPVLYMRVRDGHLFTRPADSQPSAAYPNKLSQAERVQLRRNLLEYFSMSELRNVCFEMGIDYDNFPNVKTDFVTAFIKHLEDTNRIDELIAIGMRERNFLPWE